MNLTELKKIIDSYMCSKFMLISDIFEISFSEIYYMSRPDAICFKDEYGNKMRIDEITYINTNIDDDILQIEIKTANAEYPFRLFCI